MGDTKVVYQWIGSDEVKITVIQNMDEGIYSFKKAKSGTRVAVVIKSGYLWVLFLYVSNRTWQEF